MVCGGTRHGDTAELFHFDDIDRESVRQPASLTYWTKFQKNEWEKLGISHYDEQTSDEQTMPHWGCPSKLLAKVCYQTLIELSDGKAMLVGGCQVNGSPSDRTFMAKLIEDETDVQWTEIEPMNLPRLEHIAFKIKKSIYVAGGIWPGDTTSSSCEKYSLKENCWEMISYTLPYPLNGASVVVGKDERYALIIGGRVNNKRVSNKVVVFTEEKGFSEFISFELKSTRHGHVSLITE
jgi:hypothetical protein